MTKALQDRLTKAETEIAEVKRLLAAGDITDNPVFVPREGDTYYDVHQEFRPECQWSWRTEKTTGASDGHSRRPHFRSEQAAQAFADAFAVMLALRVQPGVVPLTTEAQAIIQWHQGNLLVSMLSSRNLKESYVSPCFATREAAEAAMKKVGPERILKAMKTLAWEEAA